jgi:tripartite-type tricarboxylate transporter receptor subunit TctC
MRKVMLAISIIALVSFNVQAQSYPNQPIRLVIPFAAGGPSDVLARGFSQKLGESLGQPIIIDNKPGAGTNLAAEFVAKSKADGYTIFLMMVGTQAINETLYKKLSYNTIKDFSPISLVASSSLMLVANPSVPVKNVADLIAYSKANPGKINFGSSGTGTPLHLGGELFNVQAGTTLNHVPYKGAAPALTDVLGGQIQTAMVGTPAALPFVKTGKLTAIGVTSLKRSSNAPEIPAIAETLPKFEVELVYAMVAPAGVPKDIINKLNSQLVSVLNNPEIKSQLNSKGFDVISSSPEQLGEYIKSEVSKWAPIVKKSGATAD